MHTLTAPTTTSAYSSGFETTKDGKVWVHVVTTIGTGSITMQKSIDRGANWGSFFPDGAIESFTVDETTKLFDLPGGWYFRFLNVGDTDGTTCYVDGNALRINVTDGN